MGPCVQGRRTVSQPVHAHQPHSTLICHRSIMNHEVLLGGRSTNNSRSPPPHTLGSPTSKIPALALPAAFLCPCSLDTSPCFQERLSALPFWSHFPSSAFLSSSPFSLPAKAGICFPWPPHMCVCVHVPWTSTQLFAHLLIQASLLSPTLLLSCTGLSLLTCHLPPASLHHLHQLFMLYSFTLLQDTPMSCLATCWLGAQGAAQTSAGFSCPSLTFLSSQQD